MILNKKNLTPLLESMAAGRDVFVPARVDGVAKFALFGEGVECAFDLVNTTMPPKGLLFPQTQKMYHFDVDGNGNYRIHEYDESREQVVFGIRPCDMRSIVCLDEVFLTKGFVDEFYANAREKLLTVCIGCATAAETCFCESMGVDPQAAPNADVMLQDCGEVYRVLAQTPKGEAEVANWAAFVEEGDAEPVACELSLAVNMDGVVDKLEGMYDHPIWENLSIKCLNCGTCTYVCPTCHCFDISQDMRRKDGVRFRCWDSCMFSEYTLMAGNHNPRPEKLERVRNRFMHKLNFFERRYGISLCVGCGRCVEKCPVALDITRLIDDVAAIDLEAAAPLRKPNREEPKMSGIEISHGCAKGERPLIPQVCRVSKIIQETPDVRSFQLVTLDGKKPFDCQPGQLGMFGLLAYGECMFVVSAQSDEWVQFTVKKVGLVTEQLHALCEGDEVSLRGPYGNWWPTDACKGKDMLFIAGGIGLPPVRSFLLYCLEHREDYGRIDLVYSGSTYDDLVFKEQLFDIWPNEPDMHVHVSLYREDPRWDGAVAYTAPFLETLDLGPEDGNRVAVICGGPSLSRTSRESLVKAGFDEGHIITTLEMRMKCGVGKCGRCNMGGHFICLDGPIFTLEEIGRMHSDV